MLRAYLSCLPCCSAASTMIHRPDNIAIIDGTSSNPINPTAEKAKRRATITRKMPYDKMVKDVSATVYLPLFEA
ncbi:hypothetical protein KEJ18_01990 [Candidatus Bathyarchaeota archaeon]|nr:hypothetical protein [Candidatus Bathyarchaeota archaeon]